MNFSIPVRVSLRCRPLVDKEIAEGCRPCLEFIPNEPQVVIGGDKSFTYDHVFSPEINQITVYTASVKPLMENLFKGFNVTVLAYGQTGSGKTFTMGTNFLPSCDGDPNMDGIISRAVTDIFQSIQERQEDEYHVKVSFIEIYNEEIIDLLSLDSSRNELVLREDASGGIKLFGLYEIPVHNLSETMNCLTLGSQGRTTGSTAMNFQSSRSHAIFTISLECRSKEDGSDRFFSKFHFVDLAGSERAKKTKAQGERFKEGVNINLGLLALGNVISALCQGSSRNHVPYRESKLTRLLQDSLGGNSHTVMIACVSPADSNIEETINTLRYAQRARKIKNKPIVNRDPNMAEIARLKKLVQELQEQLVNYQHLGVPSNALARERTQTSVPFSESKSRYESEMIASLNKKNEELDSENKKLAHELGLLIEQAADLYEKNFLAENKQQQLKQKLEELQQETSSTYELLNKSCNDEQKWCFKEQLEKMQLLKDKISEIQVEQEMKETSLQQTINNNLIDDNGNQDGNEATNKERTLRQAEMNRELQMLNKALALKEDLATRLTDNDAKFDAMRKQYEENKQLLEHEIMSLQQEKDDLSEALRTVQTNNALTKISEQRRKRLKELEEQISGLKKKLSEYSKLNKIKEQNDQQIKKLNQEILEMKQARVRLVRQLKSEAEKQRQWKLAKEKELCKVKAQERRCQLEIVRRQQKFDKEYVVWKIKMDNAVAANKRLKEVLLQQKLNADKRNKGQNETGVNKLKDWINQELDFAFSHKEAKHHLDSLIEDRKVLSEQVSNLKLKLDKKISHSSSSDESDDSSQELDSKDILTRINELELSIQSRNIQISELQQKLLDFDPDERAKLRWSTLQSMSDAKFLLKHLFDGCITAKFETSIKEGQLTELESQYEQLEKTFQKALLDYENLKQTHELELLELRRENQDKMVFLLNELSKSSVSAHYETGQTPLIQRLKILEDELGSFVEVKEQLAEKTAECEQLKSSKDQMITPRPSIKPRIKPAVQTNGVYCSDLENSDDSDPDDVKMDPDWYNTPLMQRLQKLKTKSINVEETVFNLNSSDSDFQSPVKPRKRKSNDDKCSCRTGCTTKRCKCFRSEKGCGENCQCTDNCKNRSFKKVWQTVDGL